MKPFRFHEVFATRSPLKAQMHTIPGLGDVAIIDDFYADPHGICELLRDSAVTPHKISQTSRNFRDYYDCRLTIPAYTNQLDHSDLMSQIVIGQVIRSRFGLTQKFKCYDFSFNLFQWIVPPTQNYQFFPHVDGDNLMVALIYLNPEEDPGGGTAFYRGVPDESASGLGYSEREDVKIDIAAHCDLLEVLPGKFNRCLVFPSWFPHGAYIGQHDFYTGARWRMNQIYFFEVTK
jgi:hypothetical protein